MKKKIIFCTVLCVSLIICSTVISFGATKNYSKQFSKIGVTVIEGGTFLVDIKLNSTHTYTDTSTKRNFSKQRYTLVATTPSANYYKNKVNVSMGYLQYFPGGVKCFQDPNDKTAYYTDPSWLRFDSITSNTKKSYTLNSNGDYCTLGYMIGGKDVVYTRSGSAKWTNLSKK